MRLWEAWVRISNSFSDGEARLGDLIFKTLLRGGDVRVILGHPDFGGLVRKFQQMAQRAEAQAVADELEAARRRS